MSTHTIVYVPPELYRALHRVSDSNDALPKLTRKILDEAVASNEGLLPLDQIELLIEKLDGGCGDGEAAGTLMVAPSPHRAASNTGIHYLPVPAPNPAQPASSLLPDVPPVLNQPDVRMTPYEPLPAVRPSKPAQAYYMLICTLNVDGVFLNVSSAAANVFGYDSRELAGTCIYEIVHPDDVETTRRQFHAICNDCSGPSFENRVLRQDGQVIDVLWSAIWSKTERVMFCVAHDISERKQVERMRQEIVQMVSHDIRGPLTAIQSALSTFELGMHGPVNKQGRHVLTAAKRNLQRILGLADDLLDIERMDAGMLALHKTRVCASSIIKQSVQAILPNAAAKGIKLQIRPLMQGVIVDEDRIVQVLVNLLVNAIKFSDPGSTITIAARTLGFYLEIAVTDQGCGIPAHKLNSVFDRFTQLAPASRKDCGGSGLGLAIAKELVELHGGRISAISHAGKGTTFVFAVPLPLPEELIIPV